MSERRSVVRACSRAPACRWPVKSSRSAIGTIPRAVASAIASPAQSVSRRRARGDGQGRVAQRDAGEDEHAHGGHDVEELQLLGRAPGETAR